MERRHLVVGQIHRHLNHATARQFHPDRLQMRHTSARFANGLGDRSGHFKIRGTEVHVKRNQGRPGPDHDRSARLVQASRAEIGGPVRIGGHAECQTFQSAPTDRLQRSMVAMRGRPLVQKHGNVEFLPDPLPEALGHVDAVLHCDPANGDERNHIGCSDPGMDAGMLAQIDEIGCHADRAKGRFDDGLRLADEGEDGAMMIMIHGVVEHPHARH